MILLAGLAAAWLPAQSVTVKSEYWKSGPQGREVLSPAVGRNGYFSLQAIVAVPEGQKYSLFVAQNPVESFTPTLYRVRASNLDAEALPVEEESRGESVFWLDLWIPPTAPVKRVRVELQLHVNDRWIIYPMEFRVTEAVFPETSGPWCGPAKAAPPLTRDAFIERNRLQDAAFARSRPDFDALRADVCAPGGDGERYLTVRTRLLRAD